MPAIQVNGGYYLTKIYLHHWHAFRDQEIEIPLGLGLHLEGDAGVGKSTLLDAIQWALLGNEQRAQWNASASKGRGDRNLVSYIRHFDQASNRYLRDQGVAHTLLEFQHANTGRRVTVGSIIEYDESNHRPCFVVAEMPLAELPIVELTPRGKRFYWLKDFKDLVNARRAKGDRSILIRDAPKHYQDELCKYFGDMPLDFFSNLVRMIGMGQRDEERIGDFIRSAVFGEARIEVEPLRQSVNAWREFEEQVKEARTRLGQLDSIQAAWNESQQSYRDSQLYEMCALHLRREKVTHELSCHKAEVVRLRQQAVQYDADLEKAEDEHTQAAKEWDNWKEHQKGDWRNQELTHLTEEQSRIQKELAGIKTQLTETMAALTNLRTGADMLAQAAGGLASRGAWAEISGEIPSQISSITRRLRDLVWAESVPIEAARETLDALFTLFGQAQQAMRVLQENLNSRQNHLQQNLRSVKQGRVPGQRAYDIQEHLRRHGPVEILRDLVESFDPDWQPVIERLLGDRRFTLIVADDHYQTCLTEFMTLSAEEAEGVHLARPHDARKHQQVKSGSLAEKIKATNWIAQGLLNQHLNWLRACDTKQQAVESDTPAVTREGLRVGGGTVFWMKPLFKAELAFGSEAFKHRQAEIEAELADLDARIKAAMESLSQLDVAQANVRQHSGMVGQVANLPTLTAQAISLEMDLKRISARKTELSQAEDFVVLRGKVAQAEKAMRQIDQTIGQIKRDKQVAELKIGQEDELAHACLARLSDLDAQITASSSDDDWQMVYTELIASTPEYDQAAILERVEANINQCREQATKAEARLDERLDHYILEAYPEFREEAREHNLELCLKERQKILELELPELEQKAARAHDEAVSSLLLTYVSEVYRCHREIKDEINRLNRAITGVQLARRKYQFKRETKATQAVRDLMELLDRYEQLTALRIGLNQAHELRETHAELVDKLLVLLAPPIHHGLTADEESTRNLLLTPTRHFDFDLEASEDNGPWFSLSRNYGKGSGGERQLPAYIVLTASMMRIYANHPNRLRLVVIDEAFNKAPVWSDVGISMLLENGLQPIVATPLNQREVEEAVGHTVLVFRDGSDQSYLRYHLKDKFYAKR